MHDDMRIATTIVIEGRFNRKTNKYEVICSRNAAKPHLLGRFDTVKEAELAAEEFMAEYLEAELVELRTRVERLRLEVEAARSGFGAPPKVFMPPPQRTS